MPLQVNLMHFIQRFTRTIACSQLAVSKKPNIEESRTAEWALEGHLRPQLKWEMALAMNRTANAG